jgi:NADH-quinone oxidoreductase subunit N
MLAYSGIAHGGYLLSTIFVGSPTAEAALIFYLIAYSFMNVGAFTAIAVLEDEGMEVNSTTLQGLASRYPAVAGGLTYCLFGLTGLPVTGGFLAKFQLLRVLFLSGKDPLAQYLAVTAILGSFFGACYYVRVIAQIYGQPRGEYQNSKPMGVNFLSGAFMLAFCLAGVALTGIFAEPILGWFESFHHAF